MIKIKKLFIKRDKKAIKEEVDKIHLNKEQGIIEDYHFGQGKYIYILMEEPTNNSYSEGLCLKKFYANIVIGNIKNIEVGQTLKGKNIRLKVLTRGKACHDGCELYKKECILKECILKCEIMDTGTLGIEDVFNILS